jgi:hypothetical protein
LLYTDSIHPISRDQTRSQGRRVDGLICPSGNLRACSENLSSPASKNISLFPKPKSDVSMVHPVPTEGRFAIVTNAGRDAVDAAASKDEGCWLADGEVVWS